MMSCRRKILQKTFFWWWRCWQRLPYLLEGKMSFIFKLASKYVRSFCICIWCTESDQAKPVHSEPDHAEWNQGLHRQILMLRYALFWDITQHRVVIPYQHLGTTYWSYLKKSRNPTERTEHNWSELTQPYTFGGLWCLIF